MPILRPEAKIRHHDPTLVIYPASVGIEERNDPYRLELHGDLDELRELLLTALAAVEGRK